MKEVKSLFWFLIRGVYLNHLSCFSGIWWDSGSSWQDSVTGSRVFPILLQLFHFPLQCMITYSLQWDQRFPRNPRKWYWRCYFFNLPLRKNMLWCIRRNVLPLAAYFLFIVLSFFLVEDSIVRESFIFILSKRSLLFCCLLSICLCSALPLLIHFLYGEVSLHQTPPVNIPFHGKPNLSCRKQHLMQH